MRSNRWPRTRPHATGRRVGALGVALLATGGVGAADLEVPTDHPTIQQAIDAAEPGATIRVAPGRYRETIDFGGKSVAVVGVEGRERTSIDAGGAGPAVTFSGGEDRGSVLRGFTITGGDASGIQVMGGAPTIEANRITRNAACIGGGIDVALGSPLIRGNVIDLNQATCIGGSGGGLALHVGTRAEVIDNAIRRNRADHGAGIALFSAYYPRILRNEIVENVAFRTGGGLHVVEQTAAVIAQNLIARNAAFEGGGVWWYVPANGDGLQFLNNTVVANQSPLGSALYADGWDGTSEVANNILVATGGQSAVHCGETVPGSWPRFRYNDVFSVAGEAYAGGCPDRTGVDGNLSVDPGFVDPRAGDYHLLPTSPAIDAGDPETLYVADLDSDGQARTWDGDLDCDPRIDLGIDEWIARPELTLSPPDPGRPFASNTVTVDGVPAGCTAHLLYSTEPGPTDIPGCQPERLSMREPLVAAALVGAANGPVEFTFEAGPEMVGQTFWVQVVDHAHCAVSNPIRHTFPSFSIGGREIALP